MSDIPVPDAKRGPGRPRNSVVTDRPPLRPDDARPSLRDRLRETTRTFKTNEDRHNIPEAIKLRNEGISFEWKRHTCKGEEDPFYIAGMRRQGWEPVDAADVPELVPEGYTGSVVVDGQLLMARRQELTDQAHREVAELSRRQIAERERANGLAPSGQAPRLSAQEYGTLKGNKGGLQNEVMRPVPIEE